MQLIYLDMYQRLRDFNVPAAVLDTIFADADDLAVLTTAWQELRDTGMSGDEVARSVADLIFKELGNSSAPDTSAPEK